LVGWALKLWHCTVEIVKRTEAHTFKVLPRRWVVERKRNAEHLLTELLRRQRNVRQLQFQAIDLRWRVPTEVSLDHRFEELRRSQEISFHRISEFSRAVCNALGQTPTQLPDLAGQPLWLGTLARRDF
jgi:hypothetical protein